MMKFEPISLEKQDIYLDMLIASGYAASDYSFINLWGWAEEYGLEWAWKDSLVWIRQSRPINVYWAPVGYFKEISWEEAIAQMEDPSPTFNRIPEQLMQIWKSNFQDRTAVQDARDYWDYQYPVQDLISLSGNKYHKKKNLLNQFMKKYDYRYADMNLDLIGRTKAMQEKWCVWRDCESSDMLSAENRVIDRVLDAWNKLRNIMGGAILVDEHVVAFCIAERFSQDTILIHFEKGFTEYSGIYQAINQMFLAAHSEFSDVNREQDLGEEGLRKAKLSYNPSGFIQKYHVTIHAA